MNPLINPLAKNGKFGWYNTFRKHVTMSISSSNANLVLIGDSIIANVDKCSDVFDKFFLPFCTLNFGISKDKIQNVLWRVYSMTLPALVEYVIISCSTNNLGHNIPLKIAEGLINIVCILKKNCKDLHIFVSSLLPRDDEKSVKRSLLCAVNCYVKELYTNQFHYIDLDSGWILNYHLNAEPFSSDNLHLNRKGYGKLSKLFIGKIESLQITVRRQYLEAPRNYTEAVSFSIVDDEFPPLLSVYRNSSKHVCPVNVCRPLLCANPSKHICSFNFSEPIRSVSSCKPAHPVDFSNPMCTVDGLMSC